MCRYALYTEDGDVYEFHSLKDAIGYAAVLLCNNHLHAVIVDEHTHAVVFHN